MIIVFVTPEFLVRNHPSTGLPNYLFKVSKSLQELGHEPIIVTAGSINEHVSYNGIEVIRKNTSSLEFTNHTFNFIIDAIIEGTILNKEVKRLCKTRNVDIIQFTSLFGLGMFYFGKTPAVLRLSSYARLSFQSFKQTYSPELIKTMAFIERISSHSMNGIISPSKVMAEAFGRDTGRKVSVIETPFIEENLDLDTSIYEEVFRNKKYFLFYGSLEELKGVLVISKILQRILKENPDYYFALIGNNNVYDGFDFLKTIKESAGLYRNRVIHIQALPHEKLYPVIQGADFVVLPSLMENLSNACIESMALGKMVIGTDGTSFEQLIKDGYSGLLAKPNDEKTLYEKISLALNMDEEQKRLMGRRAMKRIESMKPDKVVVQLIRYYEAVINNVSLKNKRK